MSKFEHLISVLNEYDSRINSPAPPMGAGDGYTGVTSDPNIVGNPSGSAANRFNRDMPTKAFSDEANHHDHRHIMPYPLEHVPGLTSNAYLNLREIKGLLETALVTNALTDPEKALLQEYIKLFGSYLTKLEMFSKDLDFLAKSI